MPERFAAPDSLRNTHGARLNAQLITAVTSSRTMSSARYDLTASRPHHRGAFGLISETGTTRGLIVNQAGRKNGRLPDRQEKDYRVLEK